MAATSPALVEMRNISIAFGGIKAVDDVSVDLRPGEVVGLLGHNGAGKSTLIKILSGAYRPDAGEIYVNGQRADIATPRDAKRHGIETIYQTLALADIIDAPTAALGPAETQQVADLVLQLKKEGIGIFLISHDIHDVFGLADRVSVMKNGKLVGSANVQDVTQDEVLGMIILGKCPPGATPAPGAR